MIPVVLTLDQLSKQKGDSGARSNELVSAISKCDFICSLFIIESFSSLFLPLSTILQSQDLDIFGALEHVDSIATVMQQRRDDAENEFKQLFDEVSDVCNELDIDIRLPRRCGRQTQRDNHPAQTVEEYFRISIYISYIEQLIEEFRSMFAALREKALNVQHLVPRFIVESKFSDLKEVTEFYESDLNGSSSSIKGEYERWKVK